MKPEPPEDLWTRMDEIHAKSYMGSVHKEIPKDCFTLQTYCQRYGISRSAAGERMGKLLESGAVEMVGKTNTNQKLFRPKP